MTEEPLLCWARPSRSIRLHDLGSIWQQDKAGAMKYECLKNPGHKWTLRFTQSKESYTLLSLLHCCAYDAAGTRMLGWVSPSPFMGVLGLNCHEVHKQVLPADTSCWLLTEICILFISTDIPTTACSFTTVPSFLCISFLPVSWDQVLLIVPTTSYKALQHTGFSWALETVSYSGCWVHLTVTSPHFCGSP